MAKNKRQAILDTALTLFVKDGIDGTSIRAIAEGAETAEGNIYRHFKSKDDLARKLFLECANHFREAFKEAAKTEKDPKGKIKAIIREIFKFAFNQKKEFSYILVVHHREEIITKEILSKPLPKDVFIDILKTGIDEGIFRPVNPSIAVAWIVGMVQRSFSFMQRDMISLPREDVVDQTIDAALRTIKA